MSLSSAGNKTYRLKLAILSLWTLAIPVWLLAQHGGMGGEGEGMNSARQAAKQREINRSIHKNLNNIIEQDHRFLKKKVRASQCFKSFHTAERALEGIEAINMIRKDQIKRLSGSDAMGQAKFVLSLFQIAA